MLLLLMREEGKKEEERRDKCGKRMYVMREMGSRGSCVKNNEGEDCW